MTGGLTVGGAPAPQSVGWRGKDYLGYLHAFIAPVGEVFPSQWGPKDVARCRWVAVFSDKQPAPRVFYDVVVFGSVLVDQVLRDGNSQVVVGRIGEGKAGAGKNPPLLLSEPADADLARAQQWVAAEAYLDGGLVLLRSTPIPVPVEPPPFAPPAQVPQPAPAAAPAPAVAAPAAPQVPPPPPTAAEAPF